MEKKKEPSGRVTTNPFLLTEWSDHREWGQCCCEWLRSVPTLTPGPFEGGTSSRPPRVGDTVCQGWHRRWLALLRKDQAWSAAASVDWTALPSHLDGEERRGDECVCVCVCVCVCFVCTCVCEGQLKDIQTYAHHMQLGGACIERGDQLRGTRWLRRAS